MITLRIKIQRVARNPTFLRLTKFIYLAIFYSNTPVTRIEGYLDFDLLDFSYL